MADTLPHIGLAPGHSLQATPAQVWEHQRCRIVVDWLALLLRGAGFQVLTPPLEIFRRSNNTALRHKIDFFNGASVDLVLELHINACDHPEVDYSTAIYWGDGAAHSAPGRRLAQALSDALAAAFPWRTIGPRPMDFFRGRLADEGAGKRHQYFAFLAETHMPAVIVEPGFLTNPAQRRVFEMPAGVGLYATACYQALCRFAGVV